MRDCKLLGKKGHALEVHWRYKGTLTGCQWPHPYSCVGLCISRIQKFAQPLHKAREHMAAAGQAGCPAAEIKPSASAHRGPELHSLLEQCVIWFCFIIFRRISRLWKYVTSCLGGCLTSSIYLMEGNVQAPWWNLLQWFLLSSEGEKWLVSEQGEPTLPYFTPTRPLDFSVIQISQHKHWCWIFDYHLDQNQDGERKDFTLACQNNTIILPKYVWYKKTDKAIDGTNQKKSRDQRRRLSSLSCLM